MLASKVGAINASVEARGSRYATRGELTGWLPRPTRRSYIDEIILSIDGEDVSRTSHRFDAPTAGQQPANKLNRAEFSVVIPAEYYGRTILLDLRTSTATVGEGAVQLDVDAEGNAVLATLSDDQRKKLVRATQLFREKRLDRAGEIFRRSCCDDLFADFQLSLVAARCFASEMDREAAQIILSQALLPAMHDYNALTQVGKLLLTLDRHGEAEELFDRAIAMDPHAFDARNGKIRAIIGAEDWSLALAEAHRLRRTMPAGMPQMAELGGTIAWLYLNISEPERALAEVMMALSNFPDNIRLMQIRGDALVRLSRYEEAIGIYRQALDKDPKLPLLRKRMASALMLVGRFGESADSDVGRMATPVFAKLNQVPPDVPIWRGEPKLPGKLLIWSEVNFGIGQNLLHGSLVPDLIGIGLQVIVEVDPRLVPVFKAAMPQIEIVAQAPRGAKRGEWMQDVVRHLPIGSLSRYLRRELADFDASRPYLWYDRERAAKFRADLLTRAPQARFLIGISWTSNNPYVGNDKSVSLADLLSSLDLPGVALVNLQYGDHDEEIADAVAKTGVPLLQCREIDNTNDLAGLCDLMGALDMVVCIGHTTAHLAGGLGIRNLVMVPSSPFSHWLGSGERCVWYPNSVVLRQSSEQRGDWSGVLIEAQQHVAQSLLGVTETIPKVPAPPSDTTATFCRNVLQLAAMSYHYDVIAAVVSIVEQRYPLDPGMMEQVGDTQYRLGQFNRAIRSFNIALAAGGDKAELTRKKAKVLLENYDLEAAEELLASVLQDDAELKDSHPELVVMHAQVLANRGHFAEVVEVLSDLLIREPGHVEAALTCAHALSRRGEHARSISILRAALRIVPSAEIECALSIEIGHAGMHELAVQGLDLTLAREREAVGVFWRAQFGGPSPGAAKVRFGKLDGSLPQDASGCITVYVCMDTGYCARYLRVIAGSIMENAPSAKLHIHLVNPQAASLKLAEKTRELMGSDRFSCSFEQTKMPDFSPEARKTYFASIRFVRLAEIMRVCPGTYYVMDADNIVRGELRSCMALMHGADLLIRNRFTLLPHLAVAACGILLGDTDAARNFIERTAEYILTAFRSGDVAWFLDQIALTIAMNETPPEPGLQLRVKQLPTALLDWDFHDDSLVWTGKGKRQARNERYINEYRYYNETFDHLALDATGAHAGSEV
ncbi:tetratricopeptide repeat protein [Croceibacterium ferulae]|uniref:tetratricopeptide repeat protein n=1 Tax=Croceibacterium ferulae TaxID=1854641 RepID=UPI000EABA4AF|nr:tetratricopeptide repeat protein [Croceibacterium ferulae]